MFGLDKTLGKLASNKKINNQTFTVSALNRFDQKVLGSNVVAVSIPVRTPPVFVVVNLSPSS